MSEDVNKELVELAGQAANEPVGSAAHMYHCAKLGAAVARNLDTISPALRSYQSLKEALEPFAELADERNLNASDEDFMRISIDVHVGDLRRARQALNTGDKNE